LPFKYLKQLGHGRSGVVDKVEDKDPDEGSVYARKNIYVRGLQKRKDEIRKAYQNEIKIVGKVKGHHHFVRLIATYTTTNPEAVGLILQPAADGGDLEHFLNRVRKPIENSRSGTQLLGDDSSILKQAFGCLAGGLAYMHQLGIRHKDIKPRNILVHEGCVTYADFGFSLDFSELQSSTTNNQPVVSKRYTAPEVLDREPRNSKSDVYALGCVYVDLLSTLTGAADIDDESEFPNDIERLQSQLEQMPVDPSMEFLADV
ncbi:kinase-like protein, partial [Trematosphaeria pertusa]